MNATMRIAYDNISIQRDGLQVSPAELALRMSLEEARRYRVNHDLRRAIETQIVPRLIRAHATAEHNPAVSNAPAQPLDTVTPTLDRDAPQTAAGPLPTALDLVVNALCDAVLDADLARARALLAEETARGRARAEIILSLLAPVARSFHDKWAKDECDFVTVTLATARLHELAHEVDEADPEAPRPTRRAAGDPLRRILLVSPAGEQHLFGLVLVAGFFRRAGWDTICQAGLSHADITRLVRRNSFTAVGISVGSDKGHARTADLIRDLRNASRNRALKIIVGGAAIVANPELAVEVGADSFALDAEGAVEATERLVAEAVPA
jgi:methanogenic corrinoid protein MtbC1